MSINNKSNYFQNSFFYGETGDRLSVKKNSDIFYGSLKNINNMFITRVGTLKPMKALTSQSMINFQVPTLIDDRANNEVKILEIISIYNETNIVITESHVIVVNSLTDITKNRFVSIGSQIKGATFIDPFLLIPLSDGSRRDFELKKINGIVEIKSTEALSLSVTVPVINRSKLKFDIYQVRDIKVGEKAKRRAFKITTTDTQEFAVKDSSGGSGGSGGSVSGSSEIIFSGLDGGVGKETFTSTKSGFYYSGTIEMQGVFTKINILEDFILSYAEVIVKSGSKTLHTFSPSKEGRNYWKFNVTNLDISTLTVTLATFLHNHPEGIGSMSIDDVSLKISGQKKQSRAVTVSVLKFYYDQDLDITRVYDPHQTDLSVVDEIPQAEPNEFFVSIYPVTTLSGGKFILDNSEFNFTTPTTDITGKYYKTNNFVRSNESVSLHLMSYGTVFNSSNSDPQLPFSKFGVCCEFQNRLILANDDYVFFSKVGDYNNFLNDIDNDSSFYIKLTTVYGSSVKIKRLLVGRGLWALTDRGIFLIGYNQLVTPLHTDVNFIDYDICTEEAVVVNDVLYYVNSFQELKAVQNITATQGYVDFGIFSVEKYFQNTAITRVSSLKIEDKTFLLALTNEVNSTLTYDNNDDTYNSKAYLYESKDIDVFVRTTISLPKNCVTFNQYLFSFTNDNLYYHKLSENNVLECDISIHSPAVATTNYGALLNDVRSQYKNINIKTIDESDKALHSIKLNEDMEVYKNGELQEIYSTYAFDVSGLNFSKNIKIKFITEQNSYDFEMQAYDVIYQVGVY